MADSTLPPTYQEASKGEQQPPIAAQPGPQYPMGTAPGANVTPLHLLTPGRPDWIDCQFCHQRAQTRIETKGEGMQFLTGTLLCLVCICLAPLPCMLHWFEETHWYCTNCKNLVATRVHEMPVQVNAAPEQRQVPSQYPQHAQEQAQQYSQPPQEQPQHQQQQQQPAAPAEAHMPASK